jgi:hypothetical protein
MSLSCGWPVHVYTLVPSTVGKAMDVLCMREGGNQRERAVGWGWGRNSMHQGAVGKYSTAMQCIQPRFYLQDIECLAHVAVCEGEQRVIAVISDIKAGPVSSTSDASMN